MNGERSAAFCLEVGAISARRVDPVARSSEGSVCTRVGGSIRRAPMNEKMLTRGMEGRGEEEEKGGGGGRVKRANRLYIQGGDYRAKFNQLARSRVIGWEGEWGGRGRQNPPVELRANLVVRVRVRRVSLQLA